MKFAEYIPLAIRTECDRSSCNEQHRLLHAAMGAMTESIELTFYRSKRNLVEELGDICWYMAIALDALGRKTILERPRDIGSHSKRSSILVISAESAILLDTMKKNIFYGKQYDREDYAASCEVIIHWIQQICFKQKFLFEDVLAANIRKLRVRYPDKFTDESAVNRDLASEEQALA